MKINLAKSAGFCFGVRRALTIALETARSSNKVYMLGDIVHNEKVVSDIKKTGIKKIDKLTCGKNKILLIRAHGTSRKIIKKAARLGYKIVDATCPMVKEIHKIARNSERKGYKIIVIGDRQHDEVRGIIGQLNTKAIVIQSRKDLLFKGMGKFKKAAIVVQSTQNLENVTRIIGLLKNKMKKVKFFNTICKPTIMKQEEIKIMPLENDAMIIIGSRRSANTRRLWELSKSLNTKSYWINEKRQIKMGWFKKAYSVGITTGSSTPESTTREITQFILSLPTEKN